VDATDATEARDALALIGASWLTVRKGDAPAAQLARQLTEDLTATGRRGVQALAGAAVAILDAVHELGGPDAVDKVLAAAGDPGPDFRPRT